MNSVIADILSRIRCAALTAAILLALPFAARGFDDTAFTRQSVLSQGRWVKVSVETSGMHILTADDLRRWGFADPSRVLVFGAGGERIPDLLAQPSYVDDLPQVPSEVTQRGVVFYARAARHAQADGGGWIGRTYNPFSTRAYYFITESGQPRATVSVPEVLASDSQAVTTGVTLAVHEQELVNPGRTGHSLLGEDFKYTTSQRFRIALPGRAGGSAAQLECRFFSDTPAENTRVELTVDEKSLEANALTDIVPPSTSYEAVGDAAVMRKDFDWGGQSVSVGVTATCAGTVRKAFLDYIQVNYRRTIDTDALTQGIWLDDARFKVVSNPNGLRVWDVTDCRKPMQLTADGSGVWQACAKGWRNYVAWSADQTASLPRPAFVGTVAAQNLHAMEPVDMVVISTRACMAQAERLAELHRTADGMSVAVVDHNLIYNEFGSGIADPGAIRRFLKMLFDRSAAASEGSRLQYVALMGKPFFDNRRLSPESRSATYEILPGWASDSELSTSTSYCSDDIFAMLSDGSGLRHDSDVMNVAIGRIPARDNADAKVYVDRAVRYRLSPQLGDWRQRMLFSADDQNKGVHMIDTEAMIENLRKSVDGQSVMLEKLYIDEFEFTDHNYPQARAKLFRSLDEGVMWWNYIGHGAESTLTNDNLLMTDDLEKLYLRRAPMVYAATCSFGRWDCLEACGLEMLTLTDAGGAVAAISASRPVYIDLNAVLSANIGNELFARDRQGRFKGIGEVLRCAKNRMTTDTNKRRYVLCGDPALALCMPQMRMVLESIDSRPVDPDTQITLPALGRPLLEGRVEDAFGQPVADFDGSLWISLYDAERSVTTRGRGTHDDPGLRYTFEQHGERLAVVRDSIRAGRFSVRLNMPAEVADNFRPASLTMYGVSHDGREGAGRNDDFFVFGFDAQSPTDTVGPKIEYLVLNHSGFRPGDAVGSTPMLLARVSDDVALNLSTAGIGHMMSVRIDGGRVSYSNVSDYFTPAADGSAAGDVVFPLEALTDGHHTLTLRVWDTSSNFDEATIDFEVNSQAAPSILHVNTDAALQAGSIGFYITHDRPEAILYSHVDIYDLSGRCVWSGSSDGRSDMDTALPVRWPLTDKAGHRVGRGIYIYRISLSESSRDDAACSRAVGKIAVK